jgi:hypothetical protein
MAPAEDMEFEAIEGELSAEREFSPDLGEILRG